MIAAASAITIAVVAEKRGITATRLSTFLLEAVSVWSSSGQRELLMRRPNTNHVAAFVLFLSTPTATKVINRGYVIVLVDVSIRVVDIRTLAVTENNGHVEDRSSLSE